MRDETLIRLMQRRGRATAGRSRAKMDPLRVHRVHRVRVVTTFPMKEYHNQIRPSDTPERLRIQARRIKPANGEVFESG
jgi:hypothetical protein